ncbi:MAG: hypothetical protein NC124_18490, partial [Clostridium sp.]|nr:hypothetical protein [Clostridium sp.]
QKIIKERGIITMNERNLTVCEMLLQMIKTNQLSLAEETAIRKALDGKAGKSEEELFRQYALELNRAKASEPCRQRSGTDSGIQEYLIFPKDFKTGKTAPNARFERNGIRFIDNPYTDCETEMIKEWVEDHPYDVRALAVGLWLSGGITPEAIINLRIEDFQGMGRNADELIYMGALAVDRSIFQQWDRFRIVKRAMDQHQEQLPYVFMYHGKSRWHKLKGNAIQMKTVHICRDIGLTYKGFSNNEVILL